MGVDSRKAGGRLAALALGVLGLLTVSCQRRVDMGFIEDLAAMHDPRWQGKPVPREVQAEVRRVVGRYRDDLRRNVDATTTLSRLYKELAVKHLEIGALDQAIAAAAVQAKRTPPIDDPGAMGVFQEALAVQYLDRRHYQAAWEALQKAIRISPANELLYYNAGLSASYLGKAYRTEGDAEQQERWYAQAERSFRRSLELAPGRQESAYALAVLLVYELGRPQEAEALLEPLKEKGSRSIDARFLSAFIHYSAGRYLQAIEEYDRIESLAAVEEKKEQAALNRQLVLERMSREKR